MPSGVRRLTLVLALALAAAPVAHAGNPPKPPQDNSAVQEYIEQIPTSRGSTAAGASNNSGPALSARIKKRLQKQAGSDASRLESAATSSGYGAPLAATSTGSGGSDWLIIALPAVLVLLAVGAFALRYGRGKSASPPTS
jgi:hypothetical protein